MEIVREKENRNLKYKFEDLDAIIFGSRTPLGDKLKIMKIIETKCRSASGSNFEILSSRLLVFDKRNAAYGAYVSENLTFNDNYAIPQVWKQNDLFYIFIH